MFGVKKISTIFALRLTQYGLNKRENKFFENIEVA